MARDIMTSRGLGKRCPTVRLRTAAHTASPERLFTDTHTRAATWEGAGTGSARGSQRRSRAGTPCTATSTSTP
ncbi:hypothetical protein GCM10017781_00390 [Deinococcus metalli]|uniref:Uncharacterized protein n=1 Tax=Deinococcus metalli TaxID=1141878 RepID=A0ABQ3JLI4_9DEIO|nr:hypothetical protein GCM10017781_00390 [Deinococcus metalli]